MSIIFGVSGRQPAEGHGRHLERLAHATHRYALDGTFLKTMGQIGVGFQPYYTDEFSSLEKQPLTCVDGNMIVFDGRLDNREVLCDQLRLDDSSTPNSSIVLAAFQRWGVNCFSQFVGDWALALWYESEHSLYLARDHAGTRNLYYEIVGGTITWSTCLETFFVDGRARDLEREYARRYLTSEPARDLTPYLGIRSVVPAHYLLFRGQAIHQRPHWSARTDERIELQSDEEYADRFLSLFEQAVTRRTEPGAPILAELSGGMDSSGIVCISDRVRLRQGASSTELLDTISYYDDSEPDWNEKPFFTAVERQRGKSGFHFDVSLVEDSYGVPDRRYLLPGADASGLEKECALESRIRDKEYRVVLSGIGGDELLGGPPNALPELADYLFEGRFRTLLTQAFSWSLASKSPLVGTLASTLKFAQSFYPTPQQHSTPIPPWVSRDPWKSDLSFEPANIRDVSFHFRPSSLDNCVTWWSMLETLPHQFQSVLHRREYRYPYLDRDLVDYLLRVPRNRLLKPGRRRFLMRNALRNIVPDEILERRRKAFVMYGPMSRFSNNREQITSLFDDSQLSKAKMIDLDIFRSAIAETDSQAIEAALPPMLRAVYLELWLKSTKLISYSEIEPCVDRPLGSARRIDHFLRRNSARKGGQEHDQEISSTQSR